MDRAPSLGPDAVTWRLHREVALLAGWGRAILLQLAHPLVAQGVAEHSAFLREPHGHVRRLRRTLEVDARPHLRIRRRGAPRRRAHQRDPRSRSRSDRGPPWSPSGRRALLRPRSRAPRLGPRHAPRFVSPDLPALRGRSHRGRMRPLLRGIEPHRAPPRHPRRSPPRSHEALQRYLAAMLATDAISVTDTARALAQAVLYPTRCGRRGHSPPSPGCSPSASCPMPSATPTTSPGIPAASAPSA